MAWLTRPATKAEQKFAYTCPEGDEIAKCIGHFRADFGNGNQFYGTWWEHNHPELKTQGFKDALDDTINRFRDEKKQFAPLRNRSAMRKFCADYWEAREAGCSLENYIFRVDVLDREEQYSFIMRMNPGVGLYNLYCYCYRTEDLEGGLA